MPEPLIWTPELIETFWDGLELSGISEELSFAKLNGEALTEFVLHWVNRDVRCLDFGGGSGHLVERLLDAGVQVAGFEPSPERAAIISERFGDRPNFLGIIGKHSGETYDLVVCTEVIEHIRPEDMEQFLSDLLSHLKIGGRLILSTPHRENLSEARVYCPVSDYTFHRWQHQRSWRVSEIVDVFEGIGFETEWAGAAGFDRVEPIREFLLRRRLRQCWPWITTFGDLEKVEMVGEGDHVVFVGSRRRAADLTPRKTDGSLSSVLMQLRIAGLRPLVIEQYTDRIFARAVAQAKLDFVAGASIRAQQSSAEKHIIVLLEGPEALNEALRRQYVRDGTRIIVRGQATWLAMRVLGSVSDQATGTRSRRMLASPALRRLNERLTRRPTLATTPLQRRRQSWLDQRSAGICATLQSPGDFPYRLGAVVEGRVLLATSSLGSGGAERQLVNTAIGLRQRGHDDVHILAEYLDQDVAGSFFAEEARAAAA